MDAPVETRGVESLQIYSEFLQRLGHRVVEAESGYWYNVQPGFYFRFPYHRVAEPSARELRSILGGRFCIGARYFTPMSSVGKSSYLMVCSDKGYGIESLDKHSARRETRRGLDALEVRRISLGELAERGHPVYAETLVRQGRDPRAWSAAEWGRYCRAAEGLEGFDAWAAFLGEEISAFLMGFLMEDHFALLQQCCASSTLPLHPNNALVFTATRELLSRPEVRAVSYGPQSLDAPASLDLFKRRMGYEARPMKQRIVFHPVVRPFVGGASHGVVQKASALRPQSDTLRKLDGIIRFYREAA